MSASIFGERFLGRRQPAWHGLGTVFDGELSAYDAVIKAGLNYEVIKAPMVAKIQTPFGTSIEEVEGKVIIMREPTADDPNWQYFGIATPSYGIVQNTEVASAVDRLTDEWPVETVGALGKGETMFITLDAGEVEIKGEKIHQYFLVSDTKDGGTTMKIAFTPVRVVCQNTLVTGLKSATVSAQLHHHSGVGEEFDFRVNLISKLRKASELTLMAFEKLAGAVLDEQQIQWVFEQAYPMPNRPRKAASIDDLTEKEDIAILGAFLDEVNQAQSAWEYACTRVEAFRSGADELFRKINLEYPNVANTAWAAYNAVVECADYRQGSDSVAESSLFGTRSWEKRRAFKAAMDLV